MLGPPIKMNRHDAVMEKIRVKLEEKEEGRFVDGVPSADRLMEQLYDILEDMDLVDLADPGPEEGESPKKLCDRIMSMLDKTHQRYHDACHPHFANQVGSGHMMCTEELCHDVNLLKAEVHRYWRQE